VNESLVDRHIPKLAEQDRRIATLLKQGSSDWETLYTHPKLCNSYYWRDYRIHDPIQRVRDLGSVLRNKNDSTKRMLS